MSTDPNGTTGEDDNNDLTNGSRRDLIDRFELSLRQLPSNEPWMDKLSGNADSTTRHSFSVTSNHTRRRPRYEEFKQSKQQQLGLNKRSSSYSCSGTRRASSSDAAANSNAACRPSSTCGWNGQHHLSATVTQQPQHLRTPLGSIGSFPSTHRLTSHLDRTPYTGWRSSENLLSSESNNSNSFHYSTPSERLMQSMYNKKGDSKQRYMSMSQDHLDSGSSIRRPGKMPLRNEIPTYKIHDSIRSVTSAIIEYCGNEKSSHRSLKGSNNAPEFMTPRSKVLWVESSFVSGTTATKSKS